MGRIPLGKGLNIKSNITTKGTFLHKFYLPNAKSIYRLNTKLSSDHLERAEFEDNSADYIF